MKEPKGRDIEKKKVENAVNHLIADGIIEI